MSPLAFALFKGSCKCFKYFLTNSVAILSTLAAELAVYETTIFGVIIQHDYHELLKLILPFHK